MEIDWNSFLFGFGNVWEKKRCRVWLQFPLILRHPLALFKSCCSHINCSALRRKKFIVKQSLVQWSVFESKSLIAATHTVRLFRSSSLIVQCGIGLASTWSIKRPISRVHRDWAIFYRRFSRMSWERKRERASALSGVGVWVWVWIGNVDENNVKNSSLFECVSVVLEINLI